MALVKRLRAALAAATISTAAMACGGSPETPATAEAPRVYGAAASAVTKKTFGIVRWHAIIEPKAHAIVMDGADAKGNIKYTSSIQLDEKHHTLTFTSYGANKSHRGAI